MYKFIVCIIICLSFLACKNVNKTGSEKSGDTLVSDLKNEEIIEYYPNGVIRATYESKNGRKNGYFVRYYTNSKVSDFGTFINDKLEGYVYSFSESGDTMSVARFKDGELLEFVRYHDGIKSMKADHLKRTFTRYNSNGTIIDVSPL